MPHKRSLTLLVLFLSLGVSMAYAQRDNKRSDSRKETDEKILTDYFTKNNIQPKRTKSGLYYLITSPGIGPNAMRGQRIRVNYTGKTLEGKTFDSNIDPAFKHTQPFAFNLGRNEVIKGWDEGLQLLDKHARATLFIPSYLAYGASAVGADIPANSILIFDVEVLDFDNDN